MMSIRYQRSILAFCILMVLWMVSAAGRAQNSDYYSPDLLAIQGRWVRADAPYVIELRQNKSHKLQASYYNPRPIHVEKTETAKKDGLQYVMIELQDVNYEGSMYLLNYNRKEDALQGVYIHGASGQRYQVSFSRQTSP